MDSILTYRGTVYPWHCDHMGHMNVMWYVGKFDEAWWALIGGLGLTAGWLRANGRGMAAVEQQIRYQRELLAGDIVCVRSRIVELREKALVVEQTMFNEGESHVAACMTLTAVHLDTQRRKAVAFAPELVQRLRGAQPVAAGA